MKEYLEFAKEMAKDAGKIMLKYYNKENISSYKYDDTIVTKADEEINELLIERVEEKFREHSVSGEEKNYGSSNHVWVCDPIDGTAMYARNIPVSVFSLALVIDGDPVLGVIYDPFQDRLYHAVKGEGAYLNDKKISVNNYSLEDKETVVNIDMWPTSEYNMYKVMDIIGQKAYCISLGSVTHASALVASGDFTAVVFPGTKGKNFDIAAAKVIVEEAGGIVTDLFGNNQNYDENINGAIICNRIVYESLLKVLKDNLTDKH